MRCFDTPAGKEIVRFIFSDKAGKARIRQFIDRVKESISFKNVLDIGCGLCHDRELFKNAKYVGIEINVEYLKACHKKVSEDTMLIEADSRELPFGQSSFDLVYSNSVFHHLDDVSFKKTLEEVFYVLKGEGFLIVLDAVAPRSRRDCLGRFLRWLDAGKFMRPAEKTIEILEQKFLIENRFFWKVKGVENGLFLLRKK